MSVAIDRQLPRGAVAKYPKVRPWNPAIRPGTEVHIELPELGVSGVFVWSHEIAGAPGAPKNWRGQVYQGMDAFGGFSCIVSIDQTHHGRLLHLSVAHAKGFPTWEVIHALKDWFFPADVAAMMVLPEQEVYVNYHSNCFHVWQIPVKWGVG